MMPTITSVSALADAIQQGNKFKYIYFWGHTPKQQGVVGKTCFSQWFPSPFVLDGVEYATAEHFMMAEKARLFQDDEMLEKILNSGHPNQAKGFGRKVRNFDQETLESACFDIVVAGNQAKFSQIPALADYLKTTGTRVIVEASPVDKIWGIGLAHDDPRAANPETWQGQNLLGFALMVVRSQLSKPSSQI